MVKVEFYAILKDFFVENRKVKVPNSISELIENLQIEVPASGSVLKTVKVAVNNEFVSLDCSLKDGDVICLLPPSSGG